MENEKYNKQIKEVGKIMIRKIFNMIRDFINIPKTLYVNFKCLKFNEAIKLPIKVNHNVKIGKIYKGCIEINCNIEKNLIKLGFSGAGFVSESKSYLFIKNGKIIFNGKATIAQGFNIFVKNGKISIGENFYANKNLQLQSEKEIEIDNDCLLGWNISIRDTDGHKVIENGKKGKECGNIIIGKHVWIASNCIILKNSIIANNTIIGCSSLVCGIKMTEEKCLLAGIPARIKKNNVEWEE